MQREPGGLAVLGHQGHPGADRGARRARAHLLAVDQHGAAGQRVDAEDGLEQLGATRALQAGDADDLAAAHGQVDAVDVAVAGAAQLERGGAGLGAGQRRREERGELATDHQPHQLALVELGGGPGGDLAAVLEHRDGVAEVKISARRCET